MKTHRDEINNMSNEDLAEKLYNLECPCHYCKYEGEDCNGYTGSCREGIIEWLNMEVEELSTYDLIDEAKKELDEMCTHENYVKVRKEFEKHITSADLGYQPGQETGIWKRQIESEVEE